MTDANGCTVESTTIVSTPDELTATTTSTPVTCNGDQNGTASIAPVGGTLPYSYSWSSGNSTGTITNIQGGNYTVTVTDANGCSSSYPVSVFEPTPLNVVISNPVTLCIGQSAVISATATGGNGGYQFTWNNGFIGSSQTVNPVITTNYSVVVSDSNGCSLTSPVLAITVNSALSLAISDPDTICVGQSSTLIATATGGNGGPYTYTWNSITGNNSQVTVNPVSTTTYSVTVTDGCGTPPVTTTVEVLVNPLPEIQFTPIPAEGCAPLEVLFSNLTTGATAYEWYFGDNGTSIDFSPSHLYAEPGFYTVTLKAVSAEGCENELTVPDAVKVYPLPVADFSVTPQVASILYPQIDLHDQSIGASWWNWDFGNLSGTSHEQNPHYSYQDTGKYLITLYVMNSYGCRDTAYNEVIIQGATTVYIPNAFTPNDDGVNDFFSVYGIGLTGAHMYIFNRWGNKVYESDDLRKPWNGYDISTGIKCPVDVYIYRIQVKDLFGDMKDYTGRVTLVE